jgi:DNA-directed RNA polymerase subunit RPC12/RpoP
VTEQASTPFWAKCVKCSHIWAAAYLPVPIGVFVKIAKRARCPKCNGRALVARQDNGALQEGAGADAAPLSV